MIPLAAFLWEFAVVRSERLGYRVQMDTLTTDTLHAPSADMPARMHEDGRYPYGQTEFAYTFSRPPADSIAAAFLRHLTDQGGKDILREFGNRPCSETEYPPPCEPT